MTTSLFHLITSLEGGGTESFLHQLLLQSPAHFSHRVYYLKRNGIVGERIKSLGIPVVPVKSLYGFYETLKLEKPGVLHTCLYRAHQVGRVLGSAAGVPLILSSQRSIDSWAQVWHQKLDSWTLSKCKYVLVNSRAAQKVIEYRRGKCQTPIIVRIDNALNDSFVKYDRWKARQTYHLPLDAIVGGTLMRLHSEKGADCIPDFAERVLTARADVHLIVAGVGPLEAKIRMQVKGTSWGARLHLIGWEENAPRFLSAIDFFWSLSREESFPQSLLEASGLGVPWIAPMVGGTEELLASGTGALTYPTSNPSGATHAAFEMLRLLNEFKRKAESVAPTIRARYSLSKMTSTFYGLLEQSQGIKK